MSNQTQDLLDHRFLGRIIESMADGVFTLDNLGRISSWNKSMERISGYRAQEALGKSCALLQCSRCFGTKCPADSRQCRIFEKKRSEAKECHLRHKDGHDIPVIKNASVVEDEEGTILGVVETVTDLTDLQQARRQAELAAQRLGEIHRLGNIIGQSMAMREVFTAIRAAGASDATIMLQGESGTGKELVAGAIHFNGPRKNKPLITVNCSALPENLLESELFGHVKGAYTGALRDRIGRFEEAAGGTVFLDEIAEVSPYIQVKLLRVLQEREIERVGESKKRKIDIRVITATHQDLSAMVTEGRFREDLYYRLKVFPLTIPPLRERKEDIPLLVNHFIQRMNTKTGKKVLDTSREVMRTLMDYHWPGNVRELQNAIEHGFVLCRSDRLESADMPVDLRSPGGMPGLHRPGHAARNRPRVGLTREGLLELLTACDWNKAEAGRRAGVSRTAIWKYMKKWNIPLQPADYPPAADRTSPQ